MKVNNIFIAFILSVNVSLLFLMIINFSLNLSTGQFTIYFNTIGEAIPELIMLSAAFIGNGWLIYKLSTFKLVVKNEA